MKKILVIALILATFTIRVDSQVFINKSKPLSKVKQLDKNNSIQGRLDNLKGLSDLSTIPKEQVNLFSNTKLEDIVNNIKLKNIESNPIAIPIKTNFNTTNSGKWDTLANGDRVWRLYLDLTQNNTSILVFKELSIPYGGFLHIFDKEEDMSFGPITFNTNSDGGGWMTHVLPFSNIVLEYVQPRDVLGNPKIEISNVAQMLTNNVDSVFSNYKVNSVQGKMPPIGYGTDISDYGPGVSSLGSPISCNDTLEAYSKSVVMFIGFIRIQDNNLYDYFDFKNGVLLSTTDPTECKAYIATADHVAWQDSIMMNDYVSFRFNWRREKPDSSCCVYPKTYNAIQWANTIDYTEVADYCGAIRRVNLPTNSVGKAADFAIVEMLDYPKHNAYFSDWNAECISDTSEIKFLSHRFGQVPLMYLNANIDSISCQAIVPDDPFSKFSLFEYECITNVGVYSGDSGAGLFKNKVGTGLFDYEYVGTANTSNDFTSLNWVYNIDLPANRPKTYLDPLNTGLLKNIGHYPNPSCQTADCCELIYTKLRPFYVEPDVNDSCCTTLIIEEGFPDDITCGDYFVTVKNIETNRIVVQDTIKKDDVKYPNRLEYDFCEKFPVGFARSKSFEYNVTFSLDTGLVTSCNRSLRFDCEECDPNQLEITLIPRLGEDCCYDLKIKELSETACQFKHIFLKKKSNSPEVYIGKYTSPINNSILGINQDSIFIRGICKQEGMDTLIIDLFDSSLDLGVGGYPVIPFEDSYIKQVVFDLKNFPCNCCDNIIVEPGEECGEYTITQLNTDAFYENCDKVDSIKVDLIDKFDRIIIPNILNLGGLSQDSINNIDFSSTNTLSYGKYKFYLFDENGDLICTKDAESNCNSECINLNVSVQYPTDTDEDPCCQTIEIINYDTNIPNVTVNIKKVNLTDPNNPIISSPLNPTPISVIKGSPSAKFDICLTEEYTTIVLEFTYDNNIVCKQLYLMACRSCCKRLKEVEIEFIKTDSDTTCCYKMDVILPTDENCTNEPLYMKAINRGTDIVEYEGTIAGIENYEFCNESDTTLKYKVEFFADDDYTNESRLCINEAEIKPCSEDCCDNAYIEAVKDTSIKNPLLCCWKFNVQDYNCEVYRVEVYDDYTNTNMWEHMRPDGSFDLLFNKKRSELYNYGDTSFLPYYTEGLLPSDSSYLSNGPIDLETLSDRITSNICISNDNTSQSDNGVSHDNVKIRLFGPNGEECILDKELKCIPSQLCCDYVRVRTVKVIDPMNPNNCCWKIGIWINEWVPPYCKTGALNFKKIEIYRDEYDVILHKYKSELYPLNSVPFPPHYSNYSLDTIGGYSKILNLADSMCQTPGTNPTDKIIILLVNADGDTCTIYGQLLYCPTIEEYVIEFTSSFNDNEELDLDNLSLGIDDLASKLSFKLEGIKINDYEILIYDMLGKKHFTYIGETVNEDIIDISALNSGVYYFVYRANGQVITKIFTIVK